MKFLTFDQYMNESAITEAIEMLENGEDIMEGKLSTLQQEYRDYFMAKLEEFDVKSPAELSDDKKKEFFKAIKDGWVKGKGAK